MLECVRASTFLLFVANSLLSGNKLPTGMWLEMSSYSLRNKAVVAAELQRSKVTGSVMKQCKSVCAASLHDGFHV